ncbi:dynein regulatory complex subunit 4-like [Dicentrarchus labrax]|uniref:dynein regulatory complex subunit 4-like n=1 Tax=Dicentrarchus labrax TaxID=13489 RepID=UPI0021F55868|nr:dynein regulatory complex subunit 4-like [Dicentrarchus labrax]
MLGTSGRGNKLCAQVLHERRELNLKHQQLELKHEQVQKEYDELQRKQTEAILDAQQKSGLKELLLERKITAVTETLEREQLKLWVALAFGQGDQTAATHIKELFESKDVAIKALKEDVSRDLKEYDDLVNKVKASGTSVSEQLPRGEIRASIRNASENFDNVMQELKTLRVSEEKETPAGPSPNSELSEDLLAESAV